MTRPVARTVLLVAVVLAAAAALTGCTNDPASAVKWLKGQSGITGAEIVQSTNEELLISGTTRGDLKPGLSDGQIGKLVDAVQDFTKHHPNVTIELGHGDLAFVVGSDADTTRAIKLWHRAEKIPKLLRAVSAGNAINAGVLRADVAPALAKMLDLGAQIELDAYPTVAIANSSTAASGSLSYLAKADCHPVRAVLAYTVAVAKRTDVGSGQLQLCSGLSLTLTPGTSLAAAAPGMRAELDAAGLSSFPVNLNNQPDDNSVPDTTDLTPGNPAFLAVLTGLEAAGRPQLGYELDSDGTLTLIDYKDPASTLLSLASSAGAAPLPGVLLKAEDVTIGGTLAQLPGLLTEATALASASPTLVTVVLTPTTGSVDLNSAVGADPDVVTAAAALKASGAVGSRRFTVIYAGYEVDIKDGVATIADPDYVGGGFMNQFVTAWNG